MAIAVAIDMRPKEVVELAETQKGFDYSQIDEGIRDEVKQAAHSIRAYGRAMQGSMINIGKRLIEIKGMLPHGQFSEWIAAEFDMSDRMARNFMNVAREYGSKTEIISVLSDTVLYMLAAPSTPEEARREVEQAAIEGKKVTVEFAKEAIRKAKPEPVQYTSAQELENMIWEWMDSHARETQRLPLEVLQFLDEGGTTRAEKERSRLTKWLRSQGAEWRIGELAIAIKRLCQQQRQAKAHASARMVYVEPKPKAEPKTSSVEIINRDLDAYEAEAERVYADLLEPAPRPLETPMSQTEPQPNPRDEILPTIGCTRREYTIGCLVAVPAHDINFKVALDEAPIDELREALSQIPAEGNKTKREKIEARIRKLERKQPTIVEPDAEDLEQEVDDLAAMQPAEPSLVTPSWVAHILARHIHPDNADYQTALSLATREQLIEALASLSTEGAYCDERRAAIKGRLREIDKQAATQAQPDLVVRQLIDPDLPINSSAPFGLADVVRQASSDQLLEALRLMPESLRKGRAPVLGAALRRRGVSVPNEWVNPGPDPRLVKAKALRDLLLQAREAANADYSELTGRHTDLLPFERAVDALIPHLNQLIDLLGGTQR